MPTGVQREPPSFPVQHAGKRRFNPDDLRQQTLAGWHRLAGIELRLAAQALEALALMDAPIYREKLAEQCARMGQLSSRAVKPLASARGIPGAFLLGRLGTGCAPVSASLWEKKKPFV